MISKRFIFKSSRFQAVAGAESPIMNIHMPHLRPESPQEVSSYHEFFKNEDKSYKDLKWTLEGSESILPTTRAVGS